MHALKSPSEIYRRVDFDARVAGSDPRQLVLVCYEQLDVALGRALAAERIADNRAKSEALTRAVAALTALQMGISHDAAIAPVLLQFYAAARRAVLDSAVSFDAATIGRIRQDISDIAGAISANL